MVSNDTFSPSPAVHAQVPRDLVKIELLNARIRGLHEAEAILFDEVEVLDALRAEALEHGDVDRSVSIGYGKGAVLDALHRVRRLIDDLVFAHNAGRP